MPIIWIIVIAAILGLIGPLFGWFANRHNALQAWVTSALANLPLGMLAGIIASQFTTLNDNRAVWLIAGPLVSLVVSLATALYHWNPRPQPDPRHSPPQGGMINN